MRETDTGFGDVLKQIDAVFEKAHGKTREDLFVRETGRVQSVSEGVIRVSGLPGVKSRELVTIAEQYRGLAFNLDPGEVGVVLLEGFDKIESGQPVSRTSQILHAPVGEELLGRLVDPLGNAKDQRGNVQTRETLPVERSAPAIMDRAPVSQPIHTGIKVVDSMIPIGRGQRQLILGDRQTGKTSIALDTIINQRNNDVVCIYCAVGQRASAVARVADELRSQGAMSYTTVVVATEDDPAGLQFIAPYAAMSMAEHYRDRGADALVIFDDLTRHARAYRELSLLLRRPPGREAYPGDIFYIHSRLLERSTHLKPDLGGGSITALPVVETQAQNLSAYIPTNLISITDGQILLSQELFQKGILPAVDVGKSVSRVGGKTQYPVFRMVASDLRLTYSQFQEMEMFTRFGARLEPETRKIIEQGRRIREAFKQPDLAPIPVPEQFILLFAAREGILEAVSPDDVSRVEDELRTWFHQQFPDLYEDIREGGKPSDEELNNLRNALKQQFSEKPTSE